jgi:hypothetical protein
LAAALAYFAIGAVWYSKILFAKKWIALIGIDMNDPNAKKGMGIAMLASFILMAICSTGLAILVSKLEMEGWKNGLKLGALTGICFAASAICINYLYEKKPMALHVINGGYALVGNIVAAVIICVWQ